MTNQQDSPKSRTNHWRYLQIYSITLG